MLISHTNVIIRFLLPTHPARKKASKATLLVFKQLYGKTTLNVEIVMEIYVKLEQLNEFGKPWICKEKKAKKKQKQKKLLLNRAVVRIWSIG